MRRPADGGVAIGAAGGRCAALPVKGGGVGARSAGSAVRVVVERSGARAESCGDGGAARGGDRTRGSAGGDDGDVVGGDGLGDEGVDDCAVGVEGAAGVWVGGRAVVVLGDGGGDVGAGAAGLCAAAATGGAGALFLADLVLVGADGASSRMIAATVAKPTIMAATPQRAISRTDRPRCSAGRG